MTIPTTIMDNSLMTATGEVENLARILRWRPGLCAIHEAEESNFYMGLNLKGKDFKSADEINRYMERVTATGRPVPKVPPETPFEKAQALVYETIGAARKKRIEKCRQALDVYPACADALVILAEYEKDPSAKWETLRQAVKAGESGLRDAGIKVDETGRPMRPRLRDGMEEGSLWAGEGRPYLRARIALAEHLYEMGKKDDAIEEYRDLLEFNPNDNQGVRYLLVSALLERGTEVAALEAAAILDKTRDASPMWAWTEAFIEILDEDGRPGSRVPVVVARAYWGNPYVPGVLLGRIPLPRKLPETSGYGTEDEAIIYGAMATGYWSTTPGALQRMADAVDRVTAGLPSPFGADAPSGRERIARLWRARRDGVKVPPRDAALVKALSDHPEFTQVWLMGYSPRAESLVIDGRNPFEHVGVHAAVEQVLNGSDKVSAAMKEALDSLIQAGFSRHEAVHFLGFVYGHDWVLAEETTLMLDADVLTGHLRYVGRLASGQISPNAVLVAPARNDQCPCGSGLKLKKCCGRHDSWPIPPVLSLARAIKMGRGIRQVREDLRMSVVIGLGRYASFEELDRLPPEDPVVILDNTAAVAEDLWEQHFDFAALWALQDNVSLARTLDDRRHLATALGHAIDSISQFEGLEEYLGQYACELAPMVEDPRESSRLWSVAGKAFMTTGKTTLAEETINRAMSTGRPHTGAKLVRAQYLAAAGRRDEARAAYQDVVKDCASAIGPEYDDLAKEAKNGLRRLEREARREGKI